MAGIDRLLHYTVTTIDRFHCISMVLNFVMLLMVMVLLLDVVIIKIGGHCEG